MTIRPHAAQSDGLPERGHEDHTHSSATDYMTGRATRPAPALDQQPADHTQRRITRWWTGRPYTQYGDGLNHVDGDLLRHQTSARDDHQPSDHTQVRATDYPSVDRKTTHTVRQRITLCRRRLVAPPEQRPHPTTNQKTTHSSERRITRWWTGRPHTHYGDGIHNVKGD